MSNRDVRYELHLLGRLNAVMVDGAPIAERNMDGMAVWQTYQQFLLDSEIRSFAKTKSFTEYRKEQGVYGRAPVRRTLVTAVMVMVTLIAALVIVVQQRKVLIFSVDKVSDTEFRSDKRIRPLYRALASENLSFVECFHTTIGAGCIQNLLTRFRPALYIEAIDALWYFKRIFVSHPIPNPVFGIIEGTDDEQQFIRFVVKKYLGVMPLLAYRISFLKNIFRLSGIRCIVGVDDARHYHAVVEAGRLCGIPSFLLQHGGGHFSPYHPGWLALSASTSLRYVRANTLIVWSDYWRGELMRLGSVYPPESLIVGGLPLTLTNPFLPRTSGVTIIMVPFETDAPTPIVEKYLQRLAELPNTEVYFKLRPDVPREVQCAAFDKSIFAKIHIETDLHKIPQPNLVVGVYSTVLYDMIMLGIPVALMQSQMISGEGFIRNKLAKELPLEGLHEAVMEQSSVSSENLAQRRSALVSERDLVSTLRQMIREVV